jgi:hypothetical protein
MIAYLGNTIIQIYSDQLTEMALGGKRKRMNPSLLNAQLTRVECTAVFAVLMLKFERPTSKTRQ